MERHASNTPALLIVDGHSYAYRAFFAIRSLSSPTGAATNAIYGFIRMLGKAMEQTRPTHAIVMWDGGLAAERMTLLPEYKAQRAAMPTDLETQLDQIVAYLKAANVASYVKDGCEADDCIAQVAERAAEAGWNVVIATSDKDFMQLVSPQIRLLNPNDKAGGLMGVEEVRAKTGVEPTQIVDWLSLIGDSVDNIPGAPGIGPKTATDLLTRFGSIDALYQRLGEIASERIRGSLEKSVEVMRRNQRLVRLRMDAACEITLEDLALKAVDHEALSQLYAGWGFKRLGQELAETRVKTGEMFPEEAMT